jgi:hypothetical protein
VKAKALGETVRGCGVYGEFKNNNTNGFKVMLLPCTEKIKPSQG